MSLAFKPRPTGELVTRAPARKLLLTCHRRGTTAGSNGTDITANRRWGVTGLTSGHAPRTWTKGEVKVANHGAGAAAAVEIIDISPVDTVPVDYVHDVCVSMRRLQCRRDRAEEGLESGRRGGGRLRECERAGCAPGGKGRGVHPVMGRTLTALKCGWLNLIQT